MRNWISNNMWVALSIGLASTVSGCASVPGPVGSVPAPTHSEQNYSIGGNDYTRPTLLRTLQPGDARIWSIAFSPDGSHFATGSESGTIRIWTCGSLTEADPQPIHALEGHTNRVFDLDFTPDGTRLVSSGRDSNVFVWDVETGEIVHAMPHAWEIRAAAISPDGTTLITGQLGGPNGKQAPTVFVWDLQTGRPLQTLTHLAPCSDISFSPDGVLFALGLIDGEASMIVDTQSRKDVMPLGYSGVWATAVLFDPTGQRLALSTVRSPLDTRTIGKIQFWDARSGDELDPIEPSSGAVGMDFTPDGKYLIASLPDDKKIVIWDIETHQEIAAFPSSPTTEVDISPDGRILAGCSPQDGSVQLWVFGDGQAPVVRAAKNAAWNPATDAPSSTPASGSVEEPNH